MAANALFNITRLQVIKGAMQACGALAKGQDPDSIDIADCLVFLQAMLKLWDVEGKKAYLYQTISFPTVGGQLSYTMGNGGHVAIDRPVDIPIAYTQNTTTGAKQPMTKYSKQQYEMLTPSGQPGPANC